MLMVGDTDSDSVQKTILCDLTVVLKLEKMFSSHLKWTLVPADAVNGREDVTHDRMTEIKMYVYSYVALDTYFFFL